MSRSFNYGCSNEVRLTPCKGCTERTITCHGDCEKYLEFAKKLQTLRMEKQAAKRKEDDAWVIEPRLRRHW